MIAQISYYQIEEMYIAKPWKRIVVVKTLEEEYDTRL